MKLFALLEKHLNRDDLVVFLDAFSHKHTMVEKHCLLKAIAEGLKLLGIRMTEKQLFAHFAHKPRITPEPSVHPDELVDVLKHHRIDFTYEFMHSKQQMISALRAKQPVIVAIRWTSSYHRAMRILRDGMKDSSNHYYWDSYRELGATPEMIQKVKNGIIPYPNKTMINRSQYDSTTHAILCVGYDAGDDAFIVRDYADGSDYNGFFKMEAKIFFDATLGAERRTSIVEAVISIDARKK